MPPLVDEEAAIRLRPWTAGAGDIDALVAAWADPAIAAANAVPADPSPEAAAHWLTGDAARRAAGRALDLVVAALDEGGVAEGGVAEGGGVDDGGEPAASDEVVVLGEVGLRNIDRIHRRAEISWWTSPDHRGRGIATAATRLLTDWALSDTGGGLAQVWARIDPHNRASGRVAAAAGFVELGRADDTSVWARSRPAG